MNSLLKRQIRKYLTANQASDKNLKAFLRAVGNSYNNFDEQYTMQQRAMTISSEELSDANKKLQNEATSQKAVIEKLKRVINTLKFYKLPDNGTAKEDIDLDGLELINFIDKQTKEIVEINKQREQLLSELESQNQELSDYAHMVSHDLKSPLRSIDALTAWLKEDYDNVIDENGKENIDLIRDHVAKMDKLISGILNYSTIDKHKDEQYDVDINTLIDSIINTIFVPKHIAVTTTGFLPIIKGNKHKLQQLFQNLIENAIKYNDKVEGFVDITCQKQDQYWLFAIKDNGKGIEPQYHERIFKTFQKLNNNIDSTGIGLSIVKKIIDLHQGKIWLQSELGIGTTFYFTLKA